MKRQKRQMNIFDFATQQDRLEMAYQLMSAVFEEEDIKWSAVQIAVDCQTAANRLVWKVNNTYFDTPEWNPEECECPFCGAEIMKKVKDEGTTDSI